MRTFQFYGKLCAVVTKFILRGLCNIAQASCSLLPKRSAHGITVTSSRSVDPEQASLLRSYVGYNSAIPSWEVEGSFKVTGARVTEHHKAPRTTAMIRELSKVGVRIELVSDRETGLVDGFCIRGKTSYEGGVSLNPWGDHRVLVARMLASLRMKTPTRIQGKLNADAFPGFMRLLREIGIEIETESGSEIRH